MRLGPILSNVPIIVTVAVAVVVVVAAVALSVSISVTVAVAVAISISSPVIISSFLLPKVSVAGHQVARQKLCRAKRGAFLMYQGGGE